MTPKRAWIYPQSGVIPLYKGRVVMVTSSGGKRWVLPKGIVEPGMTAAESAAKEALEEGGIVGKVKSRSVGSYTYEKWDGLCEVEMFVMKVERLLDEWDEMDVRDRELVSPEEAVARVKPKELRRILEGLEL